MTRKEAVNILKHLKPQKHYDENDAYYIGQALSIAIEALSQEPCDKCKYFDGNSCQHYDYKVGYTQGYEEASKRFRQEPISVSVSDKEPDEISEEVTLRFFRNTLKVRWQDMVIYNVEWLKKNWQMEMDIVCGVKPCDDVVSRQAVLSKKIYTETEEGWSGYTVDADYIEQLSSVRPQEQTGHWIHIINDKWKCSRCENIILTEGSWEKPVDKYCKGCGAKMVEPKESEG